MHTLPVLHTVALLKIKTLPETFGAIALGILKEYQKQYCSQYFVGETY